MKRSRSENLVRGEVSRQNPDQGETEPVDWENHTIEGLKPGGTGERGQEGRELQTKKEDDLIHKGDLCTPLQTILQQVKAGRGSDDYSNY